MLKNEGLLKLSTWQKRYPKRRNQPRGVAIKRKYSRSDIVELLRLFSIDSTVKITGATTREVNKISRMRHANS